MDPSFFFFFFFILRDRGRVTPAVKVLLIQFPQNAEGQQETERDDFGQTRRLTERLLLSVPRIHSASLKLIHFTSKKKKKSHFKSEAKWIKGQRRSNERLWLWEYIETEGASFSTCRESSSDGGKIGLLSINGMNFHHNNKREMVRVSSWDRPTERGALRSLALKSHVWKITQTAYGEVWKSNNTHCMTDFYQTQLKSVHLLSQLKSRVTMSGKQFSPPAYLRVLRQWCMI